MFVRWQKRRRGSRAFGLARGKDVHWAAVLVESNRVDGKPRQQHIAYLGGITDSGIEIAAQRAWFWQEVAHQFDRLANRISRDDRRRLEATIAKKVPRLTREEYDECVAKWSTLEVKPEGQPRFNVCGA